jgi:hypothetical protein
MVRWLQRMAAHDIVAPQEVSMQVSRKRVSKWAPLAVLTLALGMGCSDDAGGGPDSSVDFGGGADLAVDASKPDQAVTPDSGVPDGVATPDSTAQPDKGPVKMIVDNTHTGWQKTQCASCHSLPVKGHTQDQSWQCAQCHGGNGACDPNGAGSSKKDHKAADSCTSSCHSSTGHGYTAANQCTSCHLASQGVVDCP